MLIVVKIRRARERLFVRCRAFVLRTRLKALQRFGTWAWGIPSLPASMLEDSPAPQRVLIVRLDEIGDAVLNSAFLRELRRNLPQAKLTLLVRPEVRNIVERCPYVNDILSFDPFAPWSGCRRVYFAMRELWPRQFDFAVNPRWDIDYYGATRLMFLSKAARRLAFSEHVSEEKGRQNLGLDWIVTDPIHAQEGDHDVQRSLRVLRYLGGTVQSEALEIWLEPEDRSQARALLGGEGHPILAVGIGAGDPVRKWPVEQYIMVVKRMIAHVPGLKVIVLGSGRDRSDGAKLEEAVGSQVINLAGRTSLRVATAILERCGLFVGNNSGPMHLAAAAGCPVVVIRNPAVTTENFSPWQVASRIIEPNLPGEELACIPAEKVAMAVEDFWDTARRPGQVTERARP